MNIPVLVGGILGFLLGRWGGLILGVILGWLFGIGLKVWRLRGQLLNIQTQFLESTFAVMGAMSKADGHVSADEIRAAETLFDRMQLSGEARESAKRAFTRGKSPGFDLDAELLALVRACHGQRVLYQMFIQVQLTAMAADGQLHPAEHEMVLRIARGLGLSDAEIRQIEAMLHGAAGGGGGSSGASRYSLDDDYAVLGVAPDCSDAELKTAYRRLMSQNHPDKLAAKGLPESMREIAEQRTREITAAYDRLSSARKRAA